MQQIGNQWINLWSWTVAVILSISCTSFAFGQAGQLEGRPVKEIRVVGVNETTEQLVRNQIRLGVGEPYEAKVVEDDVVRITHLGRFYPFTPQVTPQPDGSLILTYTLKELPILADVVFGGNKVFQDRELALAVAIRAGDAAEPFLINRGKQRIEDMYKDRGYFLAAVEIDQELLEQQNILLYQIREGPRIKIKGIVFEGNENYSTDELKSRIRSRSYIPIFRKGVLSDEQIELDRATIRQFYLDRGYLEGEVASDIRISPNFRDAVVVFSITEGRRYIVDSITIDGNELFADEQIIRAMTLKVGDAFSERSVDRSQEAIYEMYGKLGFLDTRLFKRSNPEEDGVDRVFDPVEPRVAVVMTISEGMPVIVGDVTIRGNQVTKQKVILRQLRGMNPGLPADRSGIERTRTRLRDSALFSEAQVTVLGQRGDPVRDVLVEVREQDTGTLSFGAGVSSDAGVVGAIDLVQRNFDIADPPESFGEMITGRAFRGAGQYFQLSLQPGNETSRYSVTFREPYFLETPFFVDGSVFLFERERDKYDEGRIGGYIGAGQRFGDFWSASVRARYETINITEVERDASIDVDEVEGRSDLSVLEFVLRRTTVDSRRFPTRGSDIQGVLGKAGALGGDYDFTRLELSWQKFWTVDEDFFGRRSVFSLNARSGYIFEEGEAPLFERFYAGGSRTIRGFEFRGVSPRGIVARRNGTTYQGSDPVGGNFLFLANAEYNFPIFEEVLRGVVFVDSGTVQEEDISLNDYRLSVGAGVRLALPFFGNVPIALDLAFPVMKEDEDDEQFFSFSVDVPLSR